MCSIVCQLCVFNQSACRRRLDFWFPVWWFSLFLLFVLIAWQVYLQSCQWSTLLLVVTTSEGTEGTAVWMPIDFNDFAIFGWQCSLADCVPCLSHVFHRIVLPPNSETGRHWPSPNLLLMVLMIVLPLSLSAGFGGASFQSQHSEVLPWQEFDWDVTS